MSTSTSAPHRAPAQVVPHRPEPGLTRCTEEVEHEIVGYGEPAEVHGHRGGGLLGRAETDRPDSLAAVIQASVLIGEISEIGPDEGGLT